MKRAVFKRCVGIRAEERFPVRLLHSIRVTQFGDGVSVTPNARVPHRGVGKNGAAQSWP